MKPKQEDLQTEAPRTQRMVRAPGRKQNKTKQNWDWVEGGNIQRNPEGEEVEMRIRVKIFSKEKQHKRKLLFITCIMELNTWINAVLWEL